MAVSMQLINNIVLYRKGQSYLSLGTGSTWRAGTGFQASASAENNTTEVGLEAFAMLCLCTGSYRHT